MGAVDTNYIKQLFSYVTPLQLEQFSALPELYNQWNSKINVVSRKDIDNIFIHHILYSLAIAMICRFKDGTRVLDVGTGGGFPGIPLAILFPQSQFHLIDRTAKKIKVVNAIKDAIGLKNVEAQQLDCAEDKQKYDFVVSRGVCSIQEFYNLTKKRVICEKKHHIQNGILYLKGEDAVEELQDFKYFYKIYDVKKFFYNDFFKTKKIVYIPIYKKR